MNGRKRQSLEIETKTQMARYILIPTVIRYTSVRMDERGSRWFCLGHVVPTDQRAPGISAVHPKVAGKLPAGM